MQHEYSDIMIVSCHGEKQRIKASKNSTPHERKQRTKRELVATVTKAQETPKMSLRLKRNKTIESYII